MQKEGKLQSVRGNQRQKSGIESSGLKKGTELESSKKVGNVLKGEEGLVCHQGHTKKKTILGCHPGQEGIMSGFGGWVGPPGGEGLKNGIKETRGWRKNKPPRHYKDGFQGDFGN